MNLQPSVVEALQASVKAHWAAIHFYTSLSNQLNRWGYKKLAESFKADVAEEQTHLESLVFRLEVADIAASLETPQIEVPRHDISAIWAAVLQLETMAANIERAGIATACEAMDDGTVQVFRHNLKGSEEGIINAEANQKLISEMGVDNYLANQA